MTMAMHTRCGLKMHLFMAGVDAVGQLSFATENVVGILCEFTERDVTIHRALLYRQTHTHTHKRLTAFFPEQPW